VIYAGGTVMQTASHNVRPLSSSGHADASHNVRFLLQGKVAKKWWSAN
jgi:hypothetical protein